MEIKLGRCQPPRWYNGSVKPDDDFGLEEDVFVDTLEKKIYIKLQDEDNNIRWQEIIHNIPVLTPEEVTENEQITSIKSIPLYSNFETLEEISSIDNIQYIENPKLRTWYKNLLIGVDENNQEIHANIYFIDENSEENLLIHNIEEINYIIAGMLEQNNTHLIIEKIDENTYINAVLSSIDDLTARYGYAKYFVICYLQNNGVSSGLIFNFEELYIGNIWTNNNTFNLVPKDLKIYNLKYRLREYKLEGM